jgi:hypothetical protein
MAGESSFDFFRIEINPIRVWFILLVVTVSNRLSVLLPLIVGVFSSWLFRCVSKFHQPLEIDLCTLGIIVERRLTILIEDLEHLNVIRDEEAEVKLDRFVHTDKLITRILHSAFFNPEWLVLCCSIDRSFFLSHFTLLVVEKRVKYITSST